VIIETASFVPSNIAGSKFKAVIDAIEFVRLKFVKHDLVKLDEAGTTTYPRILHAADEYRPSDAAKRSTVAGPDHPRRRRSKGSAGGFDLDKYFAVKLRKLALLLERLRSDRIVSRDVGMDGPRRHQSCQAVIVCNTAKGAVP